MRGGRPLVCYLGRPGPADQFREGVAPAEPSARGGRPEPRPQAPVPEIGPLGATSRPAPREWIGSRADGGAGASRLRDGCDSRSLSRPSDLMAQKSPRRLMLEQSLSEEPNDPFLRYGLALQCL